MRSEETRSKASSSSVKTKRPAIDRSLTMHERFMPNTGKKSNLFSKNLKLKANVRKICASKTTFLSRKSEKAANASITCDSPVCSSRLGTESSMN